MAAKLPVSWATEDSGAGLAVDGFLAARFVDLVVDSVTAASEWVGESRASVVVEVNNFVVTALLVLGEVSYTIAARITTLDEVLGLAWGVASGGWGRGTGGGGGRWLSSALGLGAADLVA